MEMKGKNKYISYLFIVVRSKEKKDGSCKIGEHVMERKRQREGRD